MIVSPENILKERFKLVEDNHKKLIYYGSCVDVGEEDLSPISNVFDDATSMAYYVGNPDEGDLGRSKEISQTDFYSNTLNGLIPKKFLKGKPSYFYIPDLDLYYVYSAEVDIHYFFKKK